MLRRNRICDLESAKWITVLSEDGGADSDSKKRLA
jgi:hypothetical protein